MKHNLSLSGGWSPHSGKLSFTRFGIVISTFNFMPTQKLPKPAPLSKHEKLLNAARKLNRIVEGPGADRWISSETTGRLKDTEEWCAFYTALADFR